MRCAGRCCPDDDPVPLVLDDALANFDDSRMGLALDYLTQLGRERQILLFTCHGRERAYLAGRGGRRLHPLAFLNGMGYNTFQLI